MTRMVGAALAAMVLTGCSFDAAPIGPEQHETKSIDLDRSEMVRVEIKMGAGELNVEGGSPKLLEADFGYNVRTSKPIVRYDASSFRGQLSIEQPRGISTAGNVDYSWSLRFNNDKPLDVVTRLGAGEARLSLGSLSLRGVEVHMGVGELRLDLRGKPKRDYDVQIHGGVGQATVYLPNDVGIVASAAGGIGSISVRGLEKRGGRWINPTREHAPVTIHLDVKGGVGEINLVAE